MKCPKCLKPFIMENTLRMCKDCQREDGRPLGAAGCSQSSITQLGLDLLREDARVNDARLSMAMDHEEQLRKLHESARDTLSVLRAAKRDIDARAEFILSANRLL